MRTIRIFVIAGLVGSALFLGGCATASQSAAMVAKPPTAVTKHPESLSVTVTGGSETSAMTASKISDADFAEAIKASVTQSGLFAKVAASDASDYHLDVQIVRLVQPMFGASFTVTMETSWFLRRRSDLNIVWQKGITSNFTATMGDAVVGVTRLRLANEGAARANIQDAITQLGAIALP
ncbi:MAG TPA: hypothetical protein VM029_10130 [Opitutaceae bacterium]|nr:hypothetical protein [Opitutaceae bacterium]